MSFHEEFSHLEVFGKAVGGNTDDRQPKSASRKTKKQQTTKTSQEKMPGELKRWFLVLIRRRKQRTFDQLGALTGEHPQSVHSVLIDVDEKNTIRKSNANEVLGELARIQHADLCDIPGPIFRAFNFFELLRRSDASIYQRVEFSKIALDILESTELPASPIARAFIHMTRGDAYLVLRRYSQLLRPQSALQPQNLRILQDDPLIDKLAELCEEAKREWSFYAAQTEFEKAVSIFRNWERPSSISDISYAIALDRVYISYAFETLEGDRDEQDLKKKVQELMAVPFSYESRIVAAHELYASWRRMANLAEAMMMVGAQDEAKCYALKAARMQRQLVKPRGNFERNKWLQPLVTELQHELSRIS